MSEDSPKIVNLKASLELSEFFSEMDFPSETNLNGAPPVAAADATVAGVEKPTWTDERVNDSPFTEDAREKLPRLSLHVEQPVDPSTPLVEPPVPADTLLMEEPLRSGADFEQEPVRASSHAGPATITEFPVRPQTPPAVALPSLPLGPVSLVELIERHNGFDWRESVAVIRQICLYLRDHAPQAPILLDPRTIQITDKGEVRLLSGQTSSDPLVIQVGRLLRTMLMGKEAPPELRLLLAQATFELPIFESIEDVDRALAQLDRLDEPGPVGMALLRAVAAPTPPPSPEDQRGDPPPIRQILPMKRGAGRRMRSRSRFGSLLGGYTSHVAVIFGAIALIGLLLVTRPAFLFPPLAPAPAESHVAPIEIATSGEGRAVPDRTASAPTGSAEVGGQTSGRAARQSASRHATARAPERNRTGVAVATPIESPPTTGEPPKAGATGARPTDTIVVAPPPPPSSLRESERRAASLLEQGRTTAAAMAFDALVMRNPLYEPRTSDLTPEALSAFRTSQKLQLPGIAQRNYELGKAALAAGDADRALALAKEAMGILDKRIGEFRPELREDVKDLLEQARVAVTAVNEIIYSETDPGVIPPRPLSAQMPLTSPIGIPPNRVGWLDMVINRDGTVFSVKLHTPLNRHHERMIVSPAKAWLYRPATKNGRAVMCRILVKVNLPESGTD